MTKNFSTEHTASYVDLANKGFDLTIEAATATAKRTLDYTRSVIEVLSKPYAVTSPDQFVRENFERAEKLVELRDGFLHETTKQSAMFANELLKHGKATQDTLQRGLQGLNEVAVTNFNLVKDAAGQQIADMAKRVEATVSSN